MSTLMRPVCRWTGLSLLAASLLATDCLHAAETIPAKPTRYFNDYALTVKPETADRLNRELENLEKESSNQVLVAVYPSMQTESDVASYCLRIFRAWQVGQKDKNNGAVLFVFVQNHKIWIQTGKGIEGALPDATCKDITADVIAPKFKQGDYDGGLAAGVEAMIAATKGEYRGVGTTQYQREHSGEDADGGLGLGTIIFLIILFLVISSFFRRRGGQGGTMFGGGPPLIIPGGFGGGGSFGGGSSSGGSSSDGGGFFSSGGGDTGGGGAGSDW